MVRCSPRKVVRCSIRACGGVVNTHADYQRPLQALLASVHARSPELLSKVIVFEGGAAADQGPHNRVVRPEVGDKTVFNVVFVASASNRIDFNGLAGLHEWRRHRLIDADVYLYIHDTSLAALDFAQRLEVLRTTISRGSLWTPPPVASHTFAFGADVVLAYGSNFDTVLDKVGALDVEEGRAANGVHCGSSTSPMAAGVGTSCTPVRPITEFAAHVRLFARRKLGNVHVSYSKHKRGEFYYPEFGMCKYVSLSGRTERMQRLMRQLVLQLPGAGGGRGGARPRSARGGRGLLGLGSAAIDSIHS